MKRLYITFTGLALVSLFTGVLAVSWWRSNTVSVSNDNTLQRFVITKGKSASMIGEDLEEKGLVKSAFAFKFYVQLTGKQTRIQAGEYNLSSSLTLTQVVDKLANGPDEVWVTIPEGLRREEIVEKFMEELEMQGGEAIIFRQEFLAASQDLEGFLFPDTYLFPRSVSASSVINKMTSTWDSKVVISKKKTEGDTLSTNLDLNETVTLASIVERETKPGEERSLVAGILLNRLDAGWPLQADASVQYGVATMQCAGKTGCNWWPILSKQDLQTTSSYNTYVISGLPPAPISNPGLSSLEAAINPTSSNYWFYLHDGSGSIHYAETIEEHNDNISKFLKR